MKKSVILLSLSLTCMGCFSSRQAVNTRVQEEIQSYTVLQNSVTVPSNEDEDPYYIEKQPGYTYRDPEMITYTSSITQEERKAYVFLPSDYSREKSYPVLYLMHGYGGSYRTWHNKKADTIIQNVEYFENGKEMLVVCMDSNVNEENSVDDLDFYSSVSVFDRSEKELMENVMPAIQSRYSVKTGRENTAIAGNSMGGRNALYIAYSHPDIFGYLGAFSSVNVVEEAGSYPGIPNLLESLDPSVTFQVCLLAVGKQDEVCGEVTYQLDTYMNEKGITHIFYDMDGGHETTVWQNALYNFVKKIF